MPKPRTHVPTQTQISAGGVVVRLQDPESPEVALISVGDPPRWQLPKGLVDSGETPEAAALREVREEAGVKARLLRKQKTVEYWYQATSAGQRVRYHKFVHFFLMEYVSGDVADHDHEVNEARWFNMQDALTAIAFKSERAVLEEAASAVLRNG